MSLFKKIMASVGVGSARVDTILDAPSGSVRAGEELTGRVIVKGGSTAQQINEIQLQLVTTYTRETNDQTVRERGTIGRFALNEAFTIQENETREIPFSFVVPYVTPITAGRTRIWVQTGLDIASALDASDDDVIEIEPTYLVAHILDALTYLGFRMREADCKYDPRSRFGFKFFQEFEYVPGPQFRGLDELELIFKPHPDYVEVFMEIDRKARGLAKLFDLDETRVQFRIYPDDVSGGIEPLAQKLDQLIRNYM
ncbi:sporulation protein [Paenibacillus tarimensis]|uniref:sporulation protein n=1 Tax=Paenibacillus tarimensis TaxID=416012 RepID=UPI001F401BA3|nr:sporulation protein [Paenibacillus tarimensis]MCF2944635.1 sporulation protein [Paenibacillus tarimensis]